MFEGALVDLVIPSYVTDQLIPAGNPDSENDAEQEELNLTISVIAAAILPFFGDGVNIQPDTVTAETLNE